MIDWKTKYSEKAFDREGLAEAATEVLRALKIEPKDQRIRDLDARTVRYYITKRLLSPSIRDGRDARLTYLHLLQVVTLRQLQAEGRSLKMIGDLIDAGRLPWSSPGALESALLAEVQADQAAEFECDARQIPAGNPMSLRRAQRIERSDEPRRLVVYELAPGVSVQIDPTVHDEPQEIAGALRRALNNAHIG